MQHRHVSAAAAAALALTLTAVGAPTAVATHPQAEGPRVYAHRGGADEAPENTMAAFGQTIERHGTGVWLELDAQLDAEGHLVVLHDDTLDRTTDCEGAVIGYDDEALADCDAAVRWASVGDEPVPHLHDVLAAAVDGGWSLMIELKNIPGEANFDPSGEAGAGRLVAELETSGIDPSQVEVQSFWPATLDRFRLAAVGTPYEDVARVFLTTATLPGAPSGFGFPASSNTVWATAFGHQVAAPDHNSVDLSADSVAVAHAAGRRVVPWTIDDPARIVEVASFGVDGIITNAPGVALTALGGHPHPLA